MRDVGHDCEDCFSTVHWPSEDSAGCRVLWPEAQDCSCFGSLGKRCGLASDAGQFGAGGHSKMDHCEQCQDKWLWPIGPAPSAWG